MADVPIDQSAPSDPSLSELEQVPNKPPNITIVIPEELKRPSQRPTVPSMPDTNSPTMETSSNTVASASQAAAYVDQMVIASVNGDKASLLENLRLLQNLPKPPRKDKSKSRSKNEMALGYMKQQQYEAAAILLADAQKTNPGDPEIANNYAYALIKSNRPEIAKAQLINVLTMAPDRSAAWANLGESLALLGDHDKTVGAFLNTYRFSRNPQRVHELFLRQITTEPQTSIKNALAAATTKAVPSSSTFPTGNGGAN